MASAAPIDPVSGATAAAAATPSATANAVGFKPKSAQGPAHGMASNGGLQDTAGAISATSQEQSKALAGMLAKLPDLDLSEMSRVKSCFSAVLGEGRENIVNGLELRVVFGELGLYPSEAELNLILRAYRDRVNLVTLTQYLRLYKKELWVNRAAAAAAAACRSDSLQISSVPAIQRSYKAFSGSRHMAAAREGGFAAGGGVDEDTLKAFVALGGNEDGGGEIPAATLRDAIRGFGLTIDIDSMIRAVDVHRSGMLDYVDFCALWSQSAGTSSEAGDTGSTELAVEEKARHLSADTAGADGYRRHSSFGSLMSDSHRRFLSMMANTPRRTSLAAGALRRRSQVLTQQREQASSPPHARGFSVGGRHVPRNTNSSSAAVTGGRQSSGVGDGNGVRGAALVKASVTPPPTPITDEEHMTLVTMYLFPDQLENTARRAPHFVAAPGNSSVVSGAAGACHPTGGESMPYSGALYQNRLSRSSATGARSRSCRQTRGTSASRKGRNGLDADGGNTLVTEFFSPKSHNVYRPPSPMILSMRSTTAHRNRLKRLEMQKRARKAQLPPAAAAPTQQQQQLSSRGGGDGLGDFDNVATTPPSRMSAR
ncbi:hypothetical protein GH5_08526 [Leishmania sp. Ghana 2012 LV757]|uniref:hypothetical protein n=1 Tax=Leishmania sp. Ghana 2012 LV757 TaxID=2803181 RepID=UPI001B476278|nr:hypothetical protein GH5_08526 [Leishmania sp. Ghana 2012 LV757]